MVKTFSDWAGSIVPVRTYKSDDDGKFYAEIDPHHVDEWHVFGSGKTPDDAIKSAKTEWNIYDRNRE